MIGGGKAWIETWRDENEMNRADRRVKNTWTVGKEAMFMNGTKVYITIADPGILHELLTEGKKRKLFANISVEKVDRLMVGKTFPISIPVSLEDILGLVGSPIVKKMFGKRLDETVSVCLQKVIEAG